MQTPTQPQHNPFDAIVGLIITKHEAQEAVVNLQQFLNSLFKVNQTLDQAFAEYLPIPLARALKQYLFEKNLLNQPKEMLRPTVEELIDYIRGLKTISITLGFSPSQDVIGNISFWVRQNLMPGILIDYTVDRQIVGGAVIVYGGVFRDFSLDRVLSDAFKKNRQAIEEVFR